MGAGCIGQEILEQGIVGGQGAGQVDKCSKGKVRADVYPCV